MNTREIIVTAIIFLSICFFAGVFYEANSSKSSKGHIGHLIAQKAEADPLFSIGDAHFVEWVFVNAATDENKGKSFVELARRFREDVEDMTGHYADVVIKIDGEKREFTAEDFLERLGFKEAAR